MEGIMMKNHEQYAVAVRKPDHQIQVKKGKYENLGSRYTFCRIPIIRGIITFGESLYVGMKTLAWSSSFYEEEETGEPGKMELSQKNKLPLKVFCSLFRGSSVLY